VRRNTPGSHKGPTIRGLTLFSTYHLQGPSWPAESLLCWGGDEDKSYSYHNHVIIIVITYVKINLNLNHIIIIIFTVVIGFQFFINLHDLTSRSAVQIIKHYYYRMS
jgi:hypothetical protein